MPTGSRSSDGSRPMDGKAGAVPEFVGGPPDREGWHMDIGFTSAIADFDRKQFDALDTTAGTASSHGRLRRREQDSRWICRYLGWFEDGVARAAVPVYRSRMRSWPDPAYDPRSWGLPGIAGDEYAARAVLLVGGCADRRTGLHADAEARTRGPLRRLLVEVAGLAADQGLGMAFPFVYGDARSALDAAADGRIAWAGLAREAHLFGLSDAGWESTLPSKVRNTLRRDRRKIAQVPVTVGDSSWNEVESWAADLIARHNAGKGGLELPEFVSLRYGDWQDTPDTGLRAFTAQSAGVRGVQTVLLWEDELEVHEVGLSGEEGDERFALYVNLLFHLPLRYARARGIDHIRLGFNAETPKAARGAVFQELYGGVLSSSDTERLARANGI